MSNFQQAACLFQMTNQTLLAREVTVLCPELHSNTSVAFALLSKTHERMAALKSCLLAKELDMRSALLAQRAAVQINNASENFSQLSKQTQQPLDFTMMPQNNIFTFARVLQPLMLALSMHLHARVLYVAEAEGSDLDRRRALTLLKEGEEHLEKYEGELAKQAKTKYTFSSLTLLEAYVLECK